MNKYLKKKFQLSATNIGAYKIWEYLKIALSILTFVCIFLEVNAQQKSGRLNPRHIQTLYDSTIYYYQNNEFDKASDIAQKLVDIQGKLDKNSLNYATSLDNLALMLMMKQDYQKALPAIKESVKIRGNILGKNHPDYATSLSNLGRVYESLGNYEEAIQVAQEALSIQEKTIGKLNPSYAAGLNNLAQLMGEQGNYKNALELLEESLKIQEKTGHKDSDDYYVTMNNIAIQYYNLGNPEKAIKQMQQVLLLKQQKKGKRNVDYTISLNNLASIYKNVGYYNQALNLYQEASDIQQRLTGKETLEYAATQFGLSATFTEMGHYDKALSSLKIALIINEKLLGNKHPYYLSLVEELADLYLKMGRYKEALPLIEQVVRFRQNNSTDPKYLKSLSTLGLVQEHLGEYRQALVLFERVTKALEQSLGKQHPAYISSLNNLAGAYDRLGLYKQSYAFYEQALKLSQQYLNKQDPAYTLQVSNIAFWHGNMGQDKQSIPYLSQALATSWQQYRDLSVGYSEQDRSNRIKELQDYTSILFSSMIRLTRGTSDTILYNAQLQLKEVLLDQSRQLLRELETSSDTTTKRIFQEWRRLKRRMSTLATLPLPERSDLSIVETQAEKKERELAARSISFNQSRQQPRVSYTQVRNALKADEAAIEFVHFPYYNKGWTDSTLYVALVLRKGYTIPKQVYLFEEKQLGKLLNNADNIQNHINYLYTKDKGNQLYRLVWGSIDSLLKGVTTIYYSPAGLLNQISFSALSTIQRASTPLVSRYTLNQLSSTRLLINQGSRKSFQYDHTITASIYGNIKYTIDSSQLAKRSHSTEQKPWFQPFDRTSADLWLDLPGTNKQIDIIRYYLANLPSEHLTFRKDTAATEESFKEYSDHAPKLLHLATHGFFIPDAKEHLRPKGDLRNQIDKALNPMLRSGLVFAGANYAWLGGYQITGIDDGILTADEVSNLNLSNTELVIMSACETGLGDVDDSEGVFGLQRAYKIAGVRYLLMSLWAVSNRKSNEFIDHFYQKWTKTPGITLQQAFKATQIFMHGLYPNEPYNWAAFILVE